MLPADVRILSIPNPFFEGRNQVYLIKSDPITLIDLHFTKSTKEVIKFV